MGVDRCYVGIDKCLEDVLFVDLRCATVELAVTITQRLDDLVMLFAGDP